MPGVHRAHVGVAGELAAPCSGKVCFKLGAFLDG